MKLKAKDAIAFLLLVAIGVPYVGYLVNGEMPFVEDPRGMAATGLVLGAAAFWVVGWRDATDTKGKVEFGMAIASLVLGLVTLVLAETVAAEALLAVFMGSILVVVLVKMADHAGVLPLPHHASRAA